MKEVIINISQEQRKFLIKIQELDKDNMCDYKSSYILNIRSILAKGYYNGVQQQYLKNYLIPDYKKWKKRNERAMERALNMGIEHGRVGQ